MDFQQTVVMVATVLGWVFLAAAIIFPAVVFLKLYNSRDKEAIEVKKQADLDAKAAKKQAQTDLKPKKAQGTAGNAELKQRLQARAAAPKRDEVMSRVAETPAREESGGRGITSDKVSMNSFLDDDMDEFDLAKKKSAEKASDNASKTRRPNFPPPPPRF